MFPASAGMIPIFTQTHFKPTRVPRKRGDDPCRAGGSARPRLVFPASAGMIPRVFQIAQFDVGVPRKRGDDPAAPAASLTLPLCSPQARG